MNHTTVFFESPCTQELILWQYQQLVSALPLRYHFNFLISEAETPLVLVEIEELGISHSCILMLFKLKNSHSIVYRWGQPLPETSTTSWDKKKRLSSTIWNSASASTTQGSSSVMWWLDGFKKVDHGNPNMAEDVYSIQACNCMCSIVSYVGFSPGVQWIVFLQQYYT